MNARAFDSYFKWMKSNNAFQFQIANQSEIRANRKKMARESRLRRWYLSIVASYRWLTVGLNSYARFFRQNRFLLRIRPGYIKLALTHCKYLCIIWIQRTSITLHLHCIQRKSKPLTTWTIEFVQDFLYLPYKIYIYHKSIHDDQLFSPMPTRNYPSIMEKKSSKLTISPKT